MKSSETDGHQWRIGDWVVDSRCGELRRRDGLKGVSRLDMRLVSVLGALRDRSGELVDAEALLSLAWPDRVVGKDSVSSAICALRRALGDDAHRPQYIVTVPRRGYRLIADVGEPAAGKKAWRIHRLLALSAAALLAVVGSIVWASQAPASIQLRPMADLSAGAIDGYLAQAIEETLAAELVLRNPGRFRRASAGNDWALESALVNCDRGAALVIRLVASDGDTYLWSQVFPLDEEYRDSGATLVTQAADELSAALAKL